MPGVFGPGQSVPIVSPTGRPGLGRYPLRSPALGVPQLLFACGAECGLTTVQQGHWDIVQGTAPTLDTSVFEPGGGSRSYQWVLNFTSRFIAHNFMPAVVQLADRFYFNIGVLPDLLTNVTAYYTGVRSAIVKVDATGQITIRAGGGAADIAVGSPVTAGTWHYLDVKVDGSGPNSRMWAMLDGGTEALSTGSGPDAFTVLRRGPAVTGNTGTINIDQGLTLDVWAYPIGPGAVTGTSYLDEIAVASIASGLIAFPFNYDLTDDLAESA